MPWPRPLRHALLGASVVVAIRLLVNAVEPGADELLVLRWMRSAADHPLRSALASALLARAAALRGTDSGRSAERLNREETSGTRIC